MTSQSPHVPNGVAWALEVKGHQFDLDDLLLWTVENPIRVVKTDGRYDLVLPFGAVGTCHEAIRARADTYLASLNGIGAVFGSAYEPVEFVGPMYTVDEHGQRRDVFIQVQSASMRTKVGRPSVLVNGLPTLDPSKGLAGPFVTIAESSSAAKDALQIVGRQSPSWSELYVAYELVEANSKSQIVKAGWISQDELNLFRRTVNNYNTLGVHARHAKAEWAALPKPMTHRRAVSLIRQLVGHWLRSLAEPV